MSVKRSYSWYLVFARVQLSVQNGTCCDLQRYYAAQEANVGLIAVEPCRNGRLYGYENFRGFMLPDRVVVAVGYRMLDIVRHCHAHGVCLRLITRDSFAFDEQFNLKLVHFDHATIVDSLDSALVTKPLLPQRPRHRFSREPSLEEFLAPEATHVDSATYDGFAADLYSIGMVLTAMKGPVVPSPLSSSSLAPKEGWWRRYSWLQTLNPALDALLSALLTVDPATRKHCVAELLSREPGIPKLSGECATVVKFLQRSACLIPCDGGPRQLQQLQNIDSAQQARAYRIKMGMI